MNKSLFIVECGDGEMLDESGDGGYTVWLSRVEAQDAADSCAYYSEQDDLKVVEFRRVDE